MLDITLLRRDLDGVLARLATRKNPQPFLDADTFRALEAERKTLQIRTEELQSRRNQLSKQIGGLKAKGQDTTAVMAEVGGIGDEMKAGGERLTQIQAALDAMLLHVPNLPAADVPVGPDEHANVEVRRWGTPASAGVGSVFFSDGTDSPVSADSSTRRLTASMRLVCSGATPNSFAS